MTKPNPTAAAPEQTAKPKPKCSRCHGTGTDWKGTCPACDGTGHRTKSRNAVRKVTNFGS